MTSEWTKGRARAVVNSVGFSESHEAAIEAALHQVADECAEIVETTPLKGKLADGDEFWRGPMNYADDIRARFPRCPDAK